MDLENMNTDYDFLYNLDNPSEAEDYNYLEKISNS